MQDAPTVPFPSQPADVPWPDEEWPVGDVSAGVDIEPLLDAAFDPDGDLTRTFAVAVVHRGRLVAERYGDALEHFDRPAEPIGAETPLLSWSMAKSFLGTLVGMLVAEGRLDPAAPADVPLWAAPDDPRRAITLQHLLHMRDGLDFIEDYVDASRSDVIEMLFGAGSADVARFAADRPLAAPPGERFNYSSGTSNIVSGVVARAVGAGDPYQAFLQERLFDALGMRSAWATFDDAGTFIGSSYVYATARDYARFGLLHLRGGRWRDEQLVPEAWVRSSTTLQAVDESTGNGYGAHWWVEPAEHDAHGSFWANGYEGQSIYVCPGLDLVVVRLGKTEAARYPLLRQWRRDIRDAFAAANLGVL